jgi:hypothetical protein
MLETRNTRTVTRITALSPDIKIKGYLERKGLDIGCYDHGTVQDGKTV